MAAYLASLHGCAAEDVVFADGMVIAGDTHMDFAAAVEACYLGRVSLSSTGFY